MKKVWHVFMVMMGIISTSLGQQQDSIFIRKIYDEALSRGKAYEDLRSLCKEVGARLSGSSQAEMAVEWGKNRLESYGFDKVYLQEIKVPHWERGTKESAWIKSNKQLIPVKILALGGSVSTEGTLKAELVVFNSLDALRKANKAQVIGKIVFINQPMDEKLINTFKAYGSCYAIRGEGAIEAAKLGAIGIVIRSLGIPNDDHPHTGSMHYEENTPRIPAAAVATEHANLIQRMADQKLPLEFVFEMDCRNFPDAVSYNVIAEITGTEKPNEIITFGGHLDSWDVGEGAHDDGAGIVHCMEALRILKVLNYRPKHTLRVVFFMNEENGNRGGMNYATWTKARGEIQVAALESDRGGFVPRGFACDGSPKQVQFLQSLEKHFKPYELHVFEKGYGGVDIGPLKSEYPSIPLFGFVPDSQRYFDYHHAESDVFEAVNKRELELGCAAISSMIYLLDVYFKP